MFSVDALYLHSTRGSSGEIQLRPEVGQAFAMRTWWRMRTPPAAPTFRENAPSSTNEVLKRPVHQKQPRYCRLPLLKALCAPRAQEPSVLEQAPNGVGPARRSLLGCVR